MGFFHDLFVFELANNHQGDVALGERIIAAMGEIAREFGIRAVMKFQYRHLPSIIHPDFIARSDVKHIPRFVGTRLDAGQSLALVEAARSAGLITACTPFDEESVDQILDHGIDIIKIASCSILDWPLLSRIAAAGRPVVCSTGGRGIPQIEKAVTFLRRGGAESLALMHCVATYPTAPADANLDFLTAMKEWFAGTPVGYSGHEAPDELDVVKVAVAKGAQLLERHVGIAPDGGSLNAYSMTPDQVRRWIEAALRARAICGQTARRPDGEAASLRTLERGVWARRPITQGELIEPSTVFFAMPLQEGQTAVSEMTGPIIASRDYAAGEAVTDLPAPDSESAIVSDALRQAQAMLAAADIHLGKAYTLELSHHYGIDRFRETGALIFNLVNRDYCKKLLVVLPGQRHPQHRHLIKEETFHVLHGHLELQLNGETVHLTPGDLQLVPRGTWHAFASADGVVIEEISTTHQIGDSVYADPAIAEMPVAARKTVFASVSHTPDMNALMTTWGTRPAQPARVLAET